MKRILLLWFAALIGVAGAVSAADYTAYGWQPVSTGEGQFVSKLVKFSTADPSTVEEVYELPRFVRSAVCVDGTYYMIAADDGLVAYELLKMDLATHTVASVAKYTTSDRESALMVFDMTYDATTDRVYVLAFDLAGAEGEGEELEVPYGLFAIDRHTGEAELMGYQNHAMLYGLAATPEGQLVVMDNLGTLWNMTKETGSLAEEVGYAEYAPTALQSMSFDPDGVLWWAGFQEIGSGDNIRPHGFWGKFTFNEDEYFYMFEELGQLGDNLELVGLYIDPVVVAPDAPAAVTAFTAVPGEAGAATCALQWTTPEATCGGDVLADGFSLSLYRDETLIKTFDDCRAGTVMTYDDTDVPAGAYTYAAVAANTAGEGLPAYAQSGFVGADVPGAVGALTAVKAAEAYDIAVSWTAPAAGVNGGWFDADGLRYKVVRHPGAMTLHEDLTALSFTDNTITDLAGYYYEVTAVTAAGSGVAARSNVVLTGPAVDELPYVGDFGSTDGLNLWQPIDGDGDGVTFEPYAYGNGSHALRYFPLDILNPQTPADDWAVSVPIRFEAGRHYALDYQINGQGQLLPISYAVTIGQGEIADESYKELDRQEAEAVQGVTEKSLTFTVETTGEYRIAFHVRNAVMFELHGFAVRELPAVDLAALSVSAEGSLQVGEEAAFDVRVRNNGARAVGGYTVTLYDGEGNELASAGSAAALDPQREAICTVNWTPEATLATSVHATVTAEGDADESNDSTAPLRVVVLGAGDWADVLTGNSPAAVYPFHLAKTHGAAQAIYTAGEIGALAGSVTALKYYPSLFGNNEVEAFRTKIYLANTDRTAFAGTDPLAEADFLLVYEGELKVATGERELPVVFDTPFAYTGGNLCVMTVSEAPATSLFLTWYGSKTEGRVLGYSDNMAAFDFSQALKADNYLPNVSFYLSAASGMESAEADDELLVVPSAVETTVCLRSATPLGPISLYAADGSPVLHTEAYAGLREATLDLSTLAPGSYIVKTARTAQLIIKK